jgi:hypothetical protein
MNLFAPPDYDERIVQLALGVEPRDALRGGRASGLRVTLDQRPAPLHIWRTSWTPGVKLDDVLPAMDRHASGRYLLLLSASTPATIRLRLTDRTRRYVPRRFTVKLPAPSTMTAAARIFRPLLHPGAGNELTGTIVRGRVRNATGKLVRWVRAEATRAGTNQSLGWAHGDDRGEFVLAISNAVQQVGFAADPLSVDITVSFRDPPMPPANDPLTTVVDPIWDLLEEKLSLPDDATVGGRLHPTGHTKQVFPKVQLTVGRTRSLELNLP